MATHDRPLLTMVVLCGLCYDRFLLDHSRPCGAIRGEWRILDGKGESVIVRKFGALRMVAPAYVN
jgi:hypothetical protein